ncbi:hypothetical protein B0A48_05782 [Cryoendolithus antarcticus]|uniref:Uncharacterized protein n=1 Tax=Cryoendolithus antarcticus TaxID=1507870 RepID=A0A1V8TCG5_9PEZI|nr:hypothetical protein B0A48_05782 [Cryoendolithus antarcticus]
MASAAARALFLTTQLTPFVPTAADPLVPYDPDDREIRANAADEADDRELDAFWQNLPARRDAIDAQLAAAEQAVGPNASAPVPAPLPQEHLRNLRTVAARDFLTHQILLAMRSLPLYRANGQNWNDQFHALSLQTPVASVRGAVNNTTRYLIGRDCNVDEASSAPVTINRHALIPSFILMARLLPTNWSPLGFNTHIPLPPRVIAEWEHILSLVWNVLGQLEAERYSDGAGAFIGVVVDRLRIDIEALEGPNGPLALQFLGMDPEIQMRQALHPTAKRTTRMLVQFLRYLGDMSI